MNFDSLSLMFVVQAIVENHITDLDLLKNTTPGPDGLSTGNIVRLQYPP